MKVLAVSATLLPVSSPQKISSSSDKNQIVAHELRNNLMDYHYGRSLVSGRSVSFKSNPNSAIFDLSKKVSSTFRSLKSDDILILGQDISIAKKDLKDSINLLKDVVGRFIFIEDKQFANTVFMKKNIEGFDEIGNLSKTPLFIKRLTTKDELVFLNRGETGILLDEDYVHVKNPEYGFKLETFTETKIADLPEGSVKQFDVSASKKSNVAEINSKNLDKIGPETTINPAKQITFKDIGGQEDALATIKQKIIFQLKYPNFFKNNKMEGIRSALFIGPPGNGKTLAALATANEAGVPFYSLNGQLLEGKYVGESAENIHAYYENARKNQPCIIFFDEMDAIFKKRTGEYPYLDQSVNMHLDEISRLEKENSQVFLLGATNHPEIMDEAVLRNGRFGTKIEFKSPDTAEKCKAVLTVHMRDVNIEDFDIDEFSRHMLKSKFSNADIAAVVAEAKMQTIERQGIFEAMSNGTFKDDSDFKLIIKGEDFNSALEKLTAQKDIVGSYSQAKIVKGFAA